MIMKINIVLKQTEVNTLANQWKPIPPITIYDNEEKH